MNIKICNKCKIEKSIKEFNKHSFSSDGYQYICRECSNKLGAKIAKCRKADNCSFCNKIINYGEFYFLIKYKKDLNIIYEKYHIKCSKLLNLTTQELNILASGEEKIEKDFNQSEKDLQQIIIRNLKRLEKQNKLSYIRILTAQLKINGKYCCVGKEGCSDLIIFFPNGKPLFLELKKPSVNSLQDSQEEFKKRINFLGYDYCLINNIIDYHSLINKYII